jgi:hypothetical protein
MTASSGLVVITALVLWGEGVLMKEIYRGLQPIEFMMRSTIVIFVLTFALLGLLLGYSSSYSNGNVWVLSTDKPEYKTGGTVVFTARNLGNERLAFPDSALGIRIQNIDTGTAYSLIASQAITYLEVGEAKQITWSEGGEGAEPGNYFASIDTAGGYPSVRAEAKFKIT